MKLFVLAPWGERLGGAESMLWTALRAIDRDRIRPTIAFMQAGPFEREVAALGLPTRVIAARRLRRPVETADAIRRLVSALRHEQPDLILNWSAKTQIYGASAALLAGMADRVIWWQHGVPDGHWIDRLATVLPARAIGCSSSAAMRGQAGLRPRRCTFITHPGIEEPAPAAQEACRRLRRELGIADGTRIIGIVGRLQPWKGQHRFLAALAILRRRGHRVHGLLVGGDAFELSPGYESRLAARVATLGLGGAVTMTGQVRDPQRYIELMDVAVNASELEPFGIVLLEAMAAKVPVVAVSSGGPLDILEDARFGMLARSADPVDLAGSIEPLLVDEELRERIAQAGRRRFRERFTAASMGERLTGQLQDLVPG
jgi:glycosyltransferase involved in cell wall biosynthesis